MCKATLFVYYSQTVKIILYGYVNTMKALYYTLLLVLRHNLTP